MSDILKKQVFVRTANGNKICLTVHWSGDIHSCEHLVLVLPALAVKQTFYKSFAEYLVNNGFISVTLDYQGIGESIVSQDKWSTIQMHHWGIYDIPAVLNYIQNDLGFPDVFVVAHSAGGQLLGLAHNSHLVRKAIFVGSGVGYWKLWSFGGKLKMLIAWYVALPLVTLVYGGFPKWVLGEKVPKGVARQWVRWARKRRYLMDDLSKEYSRWYDQLDKPILFVTVQDDGYAPKKAVSVLRDFYSNARIEEWHIVPQSYGYKSIGHFGFFRGKEALWTELVTWLNNEYNFIRTH